MRLSKLSIILFAALFMGLTNAETSSTSTGTSVDIGTQTPEKPTTTVGTQTPDILGVNKFIGDGHNIVVGENSHSSGFKGNIVLGSDSTNGSSSGIVIGTNSHIDPGIYWKDDKGNIKWDARHNSTHSTVIGNETSINNTCWALVLGDKATINGAGTVAVGHQSTVNAHGTTLGNFSEAQSEYSVALGNGAKADRNAHTYGYNPATGETYTLNDNPGEVGAERLAILKKLEASRIELESQLLETKRKSHQAELDRKEMLDEIAKKTFKNEADKKQFMKDKQAQLAELDAAVNAYEESPTYKKLKMTENYLRAYGGKGIHPVKSTDGAVSVGRDQISTRQITNLAAGTTDTDAVNVRQLKDMRKYANSRIEAVEESLASQDNRISAVEHGLAAQNSRLNKMDKKFERGLAANAALAGLMQPYNVKKFNITVGLGGYRSATAIAAGAGYRFSNNAAVRAGIATNTANFDDLSYNVSTAFEF